jgi:hypothetical protein
LIRITPDGMDIFDLASLEILYCEIMHVPCLLERGDIRSLVDSRCEVEC